MPTYNFYYKKVVEAKSFEEAIKNKTKPQLSSVEVEQKTEQVPLIGFTVETDYED